MFNPGFQAVRAGAGLHQSLNFSALRFSGIGQPEKPARLPEAKVTDVPPLVREIRTLEPELLQAFKSWVRNKPVQFADIMFQPPGLSKNSGAKPCNALFAALGEPERPNLWMLDLTLKGNALPGGVLGYLGGLDLQTGKIVGLAEKVKQSPADRKGRLQEVDSPSVGDLMLPYFKAAMQAAVRQNASRPTSLAGGSGGFWAPPAARLILPTQQQAGDAKPRRLLKA